MSSVHTSEISISTRSRWKAVRVVVCLGLLAGMVLSWRLWLSSGRRFPVLPCFGLGALPAPFDWALFIGVLGLSVMAMVRAWSRSVAAGLVVAMLVLGILDQMRWQPWAYQYLLCLAPMAFVGKRDDEVGMAAALDIVRLIVIGIYVWSGIHKFGVQFQRTYETDVVVRLLESTTGFVRELILWGGHAVPFVEISIGILLMLPRVRALGVWLAIGTHVFVLLMFGPFGTTTNSVIWPWNLAMVGLVLALFWRFEGLALGRLFSVPRLRLPALAIGIVVLLMPYWSYAKRWDQYLSFHLYSGHHQRMVLMLSNASAAELDAHCQSVMIPSAAAPGQAPTHKELSFSRLAMAELNVPMPSEDRLLLRVSKTLADSFELTVEDYFYRDYPELLEERGWDRYSPLEIKLMSRFPNFRQGGAR